MDGVVRSVDTAPGRKAYALGRLGFWQKTKPVGPGRTAVGLALKKDSEFSQISRKNGVKSHAGFTEILEKQQKATFVFQRLS
jgi:hypothetical protein